MYAQTKVHPPLSLALGQETDCGIYDSTLQEGRVLGFYCNHFMRNVLTTIITTSHSLLREEIAVLQMNDSHIKAVGTAPIDDHHYTPHLVMIGRVLPIGLYQTAGWIALSLTVGKEVVQRDGSTGRVQIISTGLD